jgi:hypothetical protein
VPYRLHPEVDEVGRPGELDHGVDHDRLLHHDAEADRDQAEDHQEADRVAEHRGQRDAAAVGEGTADHEHHRRPRDHDEDERRDTEGEQLLQADHHAQSAAPLSHPPPGFHPGYDATFRSSRLPSGNQDVASYPDQARS